MTVNTTVENTPFTLTPGLQVDDAEAQYWIRQVTVRLRREICWIWYEQGVSSQARPDNLPRFRDKASLALNMQRFWKKKQQFFKNDPTAKYLSEQLETQLSASEDACQPGSFGWVAQTLGLSAVEKFVLALGLIMVFDSATGSVIAACHNDQNKTQPTLALAQRLWDKPEAIMRIADPTHTLFQHGMLQFLNPMYEDSRVEWERPIFVPFIVARQLLFAEQEGLDGLQWIQPRKKEKLELIETEYLIAVRLDQNQKPGMQFVPVRGVPGSACEETIKRIQNFRNKSMFQFSADPKLLKQHKYLDALAAYCWLKGADLVLDHDQTRIVMGEKASLDLEQLPKISIPITVFLTVTERKQINQLPQSYVMPLIDVPSLEYRERVSLWKQTLGKKAEKAQSDIEECARRFRFQKHTIIKVAQSLLGYNKSLTTECLIEACRQEVDLDLGDLAQRVKPRFEREKVILPPKQTGQFREILKAMRALTEVHYEWGTEKVWNESGISVLFAGPPGTGKTMAAEIIAIEQRLPMFRIDLSQVVSKYIGETEKNLKRVFDMADISDTILFFDEADSLFGKRSEVKDAHDRYANLEISYLLERMERFKGLAILATNRKKDLDEAFLRRLRYIIDFPLPGIEERRKIWQQVIPGNVDSSQLDFNFLSQKFSLAGGHIRSVIFNACLQSAGRPLIAGGQFKGRLQMENVIVAIKREYEKINRSISLEQFGPYAGIIEQREKEYARHSH